MIILLMAILASMSLSSLYSHRCLLWLDPRSSLPRHHHPPSHASCGRPVRAKERPQNHAANQATSSIISNVAIGQCGCR